MEINMADCVQLTQGGVSANTAVCINSLGGACKMWCRILQILSTACSDTQLMI